MRILKSILAILLLVGMLTACDLSSILSLKFEDFTTEPTTTPAEPTEEDFYPEPIKQLLANNQPYSLEFTSNGDGTCYLSRLYLNNRYKTPFDVIIPEKSPAGDVVTGIDLGDSLTDPYDVIPKYMTWERAEKIKAQVEADYPNVDSGKVGEWWIGAYTEYDISKMESEFREEMIQKYPILEYTVMGCFFPKLSNLWDTFQRIQYADITPSVTKQCYEELLQQAREAGAPEEVLTPYKELLEAVPAYANYSKQIRYLYVPSSVININVDSLIWSVPIEGIVLPVLDMTTTIAIQNTLRCYLFSQSTSSVGYEEIDNFAIYSPEEPENDVLAWHYVDGVPTLWR